MHYWPDYPEILAGRDTLQGGSWLGVNTAGRFCAVTNFRTGEPAHAQAKSRGGLVQQYLSGANTDCHFINHLQNGYKHYNPFNLVFGMAAANPGQIRIFSSQDASLHRLADGFHSLSNGFIGQHWPKMSHGVQRLSALINRNSPIKVSELNAIMRDQTKADPDCLPSTGVSRELERHLSSIFISGSDYGTRTTTYLLYSHQELTIHEINYHSDGNTVDEQMFSHPYPDR